MAVQEPKRESSRSRADHDSEETKPSVQAPSSLSEIDSILDEIDATLEQNAAAFVAAFVQKGGE